MHFVLHGDALTPLLPHPLDVLQVAQQDLVVHGRPQVPRFEEVHAVQVGDVHPPLVGLRAVRAVLLNVHAKETDLGPVDVLEGEQGLHPVGEGLGHLSVVHEPEMEKKENVETKKNFLVFGSCFLFCFFTRRTLTFKKNIYHNFRLVYNFYPFTSVVPPNTSDQQNYRTDCDAVVAQGRNRVLFFPDYKWRFYFIV